MSVKLSSLFTNSDGHGIGKSNFVPTKTCRLFTNLLLFFICGNVALDFFSGLFGISSFSQIVRMTFFALLLYIELRLDPKGFCILFLALTSIVIQSVLLQAFSTEGMTASTLLYDISIGIKLIICFAVFFASKSLIRCKALSINQVKKAISIAAIYVPILYLGSIALGLGASSYWDGSGYKSVFSSLNSINVLRALLRSIPSINCALNTSVLFDENIDFHGKVKAFSDFVGYTVQASAGIVPDEPKDAKKSMSIFNASELQEYDNYLTLSKALAPLTEGKDINPETVKSSFKEFVLKKNPNSAADVEAQEMEYHWGALHCLEDSEVELLANELKTMLAKGQYSQEWFYKIIGFSLNLINLGFWDESYREKLLDSLRLAANHDPKCDAAALRQERDNFNDFYGTDANLIMDKLITEVEQDERERDLNRINFEFSIVDQNTGKTISAFFEEVIKSEHQNRILDVPAETVAMSTYEGTADSQNSLHSFFHTGMKRYKDTHSLNEAVGWLKKIDAQLVKVGSKSRMGGLRTKWIRNDIKEAIETLSERAQCASTESDSVM